ncbi:MAG TPA: DUF3592 domain-containing protein [Gemmataceae bacterium]|jgi:uncharacterized protein YjeT (DUF2065 family)
MSTPTPQQAWAKIERSLYRGQILGRAFGTLLVLCGLGMAVAPALWLRSARTEGTVTKLEPKIELVGHGSPQAGEIVWYEEVMVYYPVVEYQVDDRKYAYRPRSTLRAYNVGEKIPVLYKMDRPGVARIDTFSERWLLPLTLGGLCVVSGVAIVVGVTYYKRLLRKVEATVRSEATGGERTKEPSAIASN